MSARAETRQQAAERLLTATDTAIRAGLTLPCTGVRGGDPWLSDDENQRAEAATACRSCPVLDECRAYAQAHRTTFGVYGGRDFTPKPRTRGVS